VLTFHRARKLRDQSGKFIAVTSYILSRYGKLVTSYDEVQEFFTEIYLKKRPVGSWQRELTSSERTIPTRPLHEVFPGIREVDVHRVARYDSLLTNYFKPTNESLVSPRELVDLCAMASFLRPRTVFEFGTYKGATTANLALNAPGAMIRTIDIQAELLLSERFRRIFAERGIQRIVADSTCYDFSDLKGSVDFVFVDGWHESPTIDTDSRNALAMLAPGGVIAWHDFGPDHPDVVECLLKLSREIPLVHVEGTALVVHRSAGPRIQ
jgi:predicted O-methyltransferase YrrM